MVLGRDWVVSSKYRCLRTCFEKVPDCRRIVKSRSEQWCSLAAVRQSSCEYTPQNGGRFSTRHKTACEVGAIRLRARECSFPKNSRSKQGSIVSEKKEKEVVAKSCKAATSIWGWQLHHSLLRKDLWLKIQLLRLPWPRSLSEGNHARKGGNGKLQPFFRKDCQIFLLFPSRNLPDCLSISTYLQSVHLLYLLVLSKLNPNSVWTRPVYRYEFNSISRVLKQIKLSIKWVSHQGVPTNRYEEIQNCYVSFQKHVPMIFERCRYVFRRTNSDRWTVWYL